MFDVEQRIELKLKLNGDGDGEGEEDKNGKGGRWSSECLNIEEQKRSSRDMKVERNVQSTMYTMDLLSSSSSSPLFVVIF